MKTSGRNLKRKPEEALGLMHKTRGQGLTGVSLVKKLPASAGTWEDPTC